MTAEELASLIGEDAAVLLMSRKGGGKRISFPKKVTPRLLQMMGKDAAEAIVKHFGGCEPIYIPAGREWRIRKLHRDGMSIGQIALAFATTEKHVIHTIKGARDWRSDILIKNEDKRS